MTVWQILIEMYDMEEKGTEARMTVFPEKNLLI